MKLYAIRRRSGWESTRELEVTGKRSARVGATMPDKVRWIRSYAVHEEDGRIGTVCIYQAESPEAIREHARIVEMPATEIHEVAVTVIVNEDPVEVA